MITQEVILSIHYQRIAECFSSSFEELFSDPIAIQMNSEKNSSSFIFQRLSEIFTKKMNSEQDDYIHFLFLKNKYQERLNSRLQKKVSSLSNIIRTNQQKLSNINAELYGEIRKLKLSNINTPNQIHKYYSRLVSFNKISNEQIQEIRLIKDNVTFLSAQIQEIKIKFIETLKSFKILLTKMRILYKQKFQEHFTFQANPKNQKNYSELLSLQSCLSEIKKENQSKKKTIVKLCEYLNSLPHSNDSSNNTRCEKLPTLLSYNALKNTLNPLLASQSMKEIQDASSKPEVTFAQIQKIIDSFKKQKQELNNKYRKQFKDKREVLLKLYEECSNVQSLSSEIEN